MEERLKHGTLIKYLRPSKLDITTNHGISRMLERPQICKFGAQTQDGSNSSNTEMKTL
jgi:hypothetical protein